MFNTNNLGGWIIPAEAEIPAKTKIPSYSEIGDDCKIGNGCTIGNACTIGNDCKVGNDCTIGDGCKIGYYCTIGNGCTIGNACTIGNDCKIGDGCTIGGNTKWLGTTVKSWITLANVDGSGRQIKIVKSLKNEITIEAGCFQGSLDDFLARATAEGKLRYVSVISAIAQHI